MAELPESIGTATMDDEGTLYLFLRAEDPSGAVGDAMFEFPRDHEKYQKMIDHLGGIQPGEEKLVPPWR
jgi:hypothetical protein